MPSRLLPLVALLLLLVGAAYWWLHGSDSKHGPHQSQVEGNDSDAAGTRATDGTPQHPTEPEVDMNQTSASSPGREVATSKFQASIVDPSGTPLSGIVHWLEINETLVHALEHELTLAAGTIWKHGEKQQSLFTDGELDIPLTDDQTYFLWIEVDGFRPKTWLSDRDDLEVGKVALDPCPALDIQVNDADASPVQGASVAIFRESKDDQYPSLDWRGRLLRRYFQVSGDTNAEGRIRFSSLPDMLGTIWVKPDLPFGLHILDGVSLSEEHIVEVSKSMTLKGRAVDSDGDPIQGVFVIAFQGPATGSRSAVGEATTDENGEYFAPGVACTGLGNTIIFYKEEYDPVMTTMPFPKVGQEVEINATMRSARSLRLQFVTTSGVALDSVSAEYSRKSLDWIPALPQFDEQGIQSTNTMFVPGDSYVADVWSNGIRLGRSVFVPEDTDDVQRILVEGVGRLEKEAPSWIVPESTCTFVGSTWGATPVSWTAGATPPWLPTGMGSLTVESQLAGIVTLPTIISDGTGAWPEIHDSHPVSCTLDMLEGESIAVYATSGRSSGTILADFANSRCAFRLHDPAQQVKLISSVRGEWVLGTLPLTGTSTDLGKLAWPESAELLVQVRSDNGDPVINSRVVVGSAGGSHVAESVTNREGLCDFGLLPYGVYKIRVTPHESSGTPLPPAERSVLLDPSASERVEIEYGSTGQFDVHLPSAPATWSGLLVTSNTEQLERSSAGHLLSFQGTDAKARWLAWSAPSAGELYACGAEVESATGTVPAPPLDSIQIDVPSQSDGQVVLRLGGRVLATSVVPSGSKLRLHHAGCDDLTLQWVSVDARGPRLTVAEVAAGRSLPASESASHILQVRLVDEMNAPMSTVSVALSEAGESILSTAQGAVQFSASQRGTTASIHHSGYYPIRVALDEGELVLRSLTGKIDIECSRTVPTIRLEPKFELSVPLPEMHAEMTGSKPIRYNKLPAGIYRLTRWTSTGELFSESDVRLVGGESAQIRDGL